MKKTKSQSPNYFYGPVGAFVVFVIFNLILGRNITLGKIISGIIMAVVFGVLNYLWIKMKK